MRTRLEVFQCLDSRFRGNDKQGGNDERDASLWSPYPKLGLEVHGTVSPRLGGIMDGQRHLCEEGASVFGL